MQKTLVILGGGTAGTMVANRMDRLLDPERWRIIVIDRDETHYYQPGFLFVPFGLYDVDDLYKPKRRLIAPRVDVIFADLEAIDPEEQTVTLADGRHILYDELVIATGSDIHPEETSGLLDGGGWRHNIFDFYTPDGAAALGQFLKDWPGGRLVVNITEMPIKCPVAPLEFLFMADSFFREKGIRSRVDLVYATPLPGAFTKPRCTEVLADFLDRKDIAVETEFNIGEVDNTRQVIRSYDDREIGYDLLVSIPTHMGAEVLGRAGLGNELNFVPTDKHTLRAKGHDNIWVIGDATDVPTSKAGSVAHFQLDVLAHNLKRHIDGLEPDAHFDGHTNCFIEAGDGKAFLIDFNYDVEPLPGKYPMPGVGPFSLLKETRVNHLGKLGFRWMYWNLLLKARPLPVSSEMSMAGKLN